MVCILGNGMINILLEHADKNRTAYAPIGRGGRVTCMM